MEKLSFNDGWKCCRADKEFDVFDVVIPHDAMMLDEKNEFSPSGVNTGWYETKDYTYMKDFFVPESYRNKYIRFEFEGVYSKATVYINDIEVAYHNFGYTDFLVDPAKALEYGRNNSIKVQAINSTQPNSRWYSGTGIYRPVWLYVLPEKHIELNGIKITTIDYKTPKIKVEVKTSDDGMIKVELLDGDRVLKSIEGKTTGEFVSEIEVPGAKLWNADAANLYTCRVTYEEDAQETAFGIRIIECDHKNGFRINGERVILRGACIHHDNGLLGACAFDFAERRKIQILKENGYNAVRSAHNPCSKAMLKACDELGILMMDEYIDVWYIHKNKFDYATEVERNYRRDLKSIVDKDYNHPSVVLYSTGNEVSETAQEKGIKLCGDLTDYFHELDPTRPVTCGINIFFNFLSSIGFGVYSDKKANKEAEVKKKKKSVGSEFYNNLAGLLGSDFMKFGATLYPCDVKTRDAFVRMDIAGYNYGIYRYNHDMKKYPQRLILGTETFCSDSFRFWETAKKNNRLIGDFVWAGMDYLGEVGIGSWEYENYAPDFSHGVGWVSAGSGRIDLTGKPLSEMKYTQVAFELIDISIGVIPVDNANKRHSPSAWKMTNAMESWSWRGCNGMTTNVEVYARADHVSLYVNEKCVGTKEMKRDCRAVFKTQYYDGEVKAVAYDKNNNLIAETSLQTAGEETILNLDPENKSVNRETDLCYVRMKFTDENGIVKPLIRSDIKVSVDGGVLLGLGSACPYYPRGYLTDTSDTYYGEALAIIKPGDSDKVVIRAESKFGKNEAIIEVN
ncbi:MAG: glycoside hydrolase family 2 TIM barrel-domain containing protein [Lachnospiraceae bacterium]